MSPKKPTGDTPPLNEVDAAQRDEDVSDRIRMIWEYILEHREPSYFDSNLRSHVHFLSASINPTDPKRSTLLFQLKVPLSLCNGGSNLHGGAVALIFDLCTSMAITAVAKEGFWDGGHVTRTLDCVYLRPAPVDTEVIVETEVVNIGRTMAQLRGEMRLKESGKVCYTCEHGKVRMDGYGVPKI